MTARRAAVALAAASAAVSLLAAAPARAADHITVTAHVPPVDPTTLWYAEPVTVTLDVESPYGLGPGSVRRVKVNGGEAVESVLTLGANDIAVGEGVTKVSWRATNPASFVTESSGSRDLYVDLTAPVITVDSGLPDGSLVHVGDQVEIRFSCVDAWSGVRSCQTPDLDQVSAMLDTSTPGEHTFVVTSSDVAGHTATLTRHYTVVAPDTTAPTVTRTEVGGQHGADGWWLTPPTFRFTATDPAVDHSDTSGVEALDTDLDGTVTEVLGDTTDVTVPGGRHVLRWAARDRAGNPGAIESLAVDVDPDPPLLAVTYPSAGRHLATTDAPRPGFACVDLLSGMRSCRFEVDGTERSTLDLTPGPHRVHFVAVDVAGRGTTEDVDYVVDAPVHGELPPAHPIVGSTTTLSKVRASRTRRGTATVVLASAYVPRGRVVVTDGTRRLVAVALTASARAGRTTLVVRLPRLARGRHVLRASYLGAPDVRRSVSRPVVVRVR